MSDLVVYVDLSEVRTGKIHELRSAVEELARFVEANEPQLIAYTVYFTADEERMSVVHVHRDSDSLAYHMRVAGPLFPRFAPFIRLLSIDLYGSLPDQLVQQLREKAQMLGAGAVSVHEPHAGFARYAGI